ncbi:hypothetical protein Tco_1284796 [Tanacetum coccineum]
MNDLKINNLTQETLLGPAFKLLKGIRSNYVELEYDFEECYKALSEKLDWENPKGGDYPFDLTKPLPLVMSRITKATQYDLPDIEDMVLNIWSPVKVAYDKHALWGISHWREQRKTFYGYARGLQSTHDVSSTKRILVVTQVEVMRKHGYGYLKEIVVRRADNDLYRFKEGDFPRLRINDIEDMLLLVVQNRLTNLSSDDVSDFTIALRMFTRSLVIQKRVEDLQLGVESYQKKINVTKPETTICGIRKRDPYTPYQDPQGFIYVDTLGRNRPVACEPPDRCIIHCHRLGLRGCRMWQPWGVGVATLMVGCSGGWGGVGGCEVGRPGGSGEGAPMVELLIAFPPFPISKISISVILLRYTLKVVAAIVAVYSATVSLLDEYVAGNQNTRAYSLTVDDSGCARHTLGN